MIIAIEPPRIVMRTNDGVMIGKFHAAQAMDLIARLVRLSMTMQAELTALDDVRYQQRRTRVESEADQLTFVIDSLIASVEQLEPGATGWQYVCDYPTS